MNRTACAIWAALMLAAASPSSGMSGGITSAERPASPVPEEESRRVIASLKSRGVEMYRSYTGVESLRREVIEEYDPATGVLKSRSELTAKRRDYFYRAPEVEILSYKKDGKELEPSTFRIMKSMPTYPVFDERGDENYTITIAGIVRIGGKACYRVQAAPKKKTMRHFNGSLYFRKDTLEPVLIEGTAAKLDFPLTSFRIELQLAAPESVPVVTSGKVEVRVNVPVFYPDTRLVTSITAIENRLMR